MVRTVFLRPASCWGRCSWASSPRASRSFALISFALVSAVVAGLLVAGCSTKSLVTERYDEDVYRIDDPALPDSLGGALLVFRLRRHAERLARRAVHPEREEAELEAARPAGRLPALPDWEGPAGNCERVRIAAPPQEQPASAMEEEPAAAAGTSSSAHRLFSRTTDLPGL
jgi:hypothetical protein